MSTLDSNPKPILLISEDGKLIPVFSSYELPIATDQILGGVRIGDNLSINEQGELSGVPPYELPIASSTTLGGIKVGANLSISSTGVLSAAGEGTLPYGVGHGLKVVDNDLEVDTTDNFTGDNTLPMTAAGVQVVVGNIEVLLGTI